MGDDDHFRHFESERGPAVGGEVRRRLSRIS
jgi:hypothetical protein